MTEIKWLTVKQASQFCYEMGLPRSTKSIRRWCQFENVDAQKRQVANTEKWFIDQGSLEIKIKEELEFLKQSDSQPNTHGQQADMTGYDHTRPDISGHKRTQADMSGHEGGQRPDAPSVKRLEDLQDEIVSLKVDVAVKSEQANQFKKLFLEGQKTIQAQSRYIGHVETKILKMGGTTDQAFLEAPVPEFGRSKETGKGHAAVNPEIIENAEGNLEHDHFDKHNHARN